MSTFIVGLTGGIGSGKTTVANMFAELAVDLIDADIVARQVVTPGSSAIKQIQQHFGDNFLHQDGNLNRQRLRTEIFADPEKKGWLNHLLHPLIRTKIRNDLQLASSPYCLLIAPLLIENKLTHYVNRTLVIDVDESCQLSRTMSRDGNSEQQVKNIMLSQISRHNRLAAADDIINNNTDDLEQVRTQVAQLHQIYLGLSK